MEGWNVTREWIMSFGTTTGGQTGWTRDQLAAIGVDWPPKSGWIDRSVGKTIPETARVRFESKIKAKQVKKHHQPALALDVHELAAQVNSAAQKKWQARHGL